MIELALMIEGQNGLTWERWQRIARTAEDMGLVGLYRSDHYTNARPPDIESLECWMSLAWLATTSTSLEFGPLVSPVSFRHPTHLARMAAALDDLSGGRLTLGMGAGWQQREHDNFGWQLLTVEQRFKRLEEGLQVVISLLRSDTPVSFEGEYYRLNDAILLPRPQRPGGPPILIGGNGVRRTLPLAARYASEWNCVYLTPEAFADRSARLNDLLGAEGREPGDVRRSMMTGLIFGRDQAAFEARAKGRTAEELRARGAVAGTPNEVVEHLGRLHDVGVQRVMLQWLDLDDQEGLEAFGELVVPQIQAA